MGDKEETVNRVLTVQKNHEKRAGNGRTGSDAGTLRNSIPQAIISNISS